MDHTWQERGKSAHWMFNSESACHLFDNGTKIIPVSAFRFVPTSGSVMSVDAERLEDGAVQGIISHNPVTIMIK